MKALKLTGTIFENRLEGSTTTLMFDIFGDHVKELKAFEGMPLDITVKDHRNKRSLNANALCWELCSQIGKAISPPISKEDVYRDAIKAVGEYSHLIIDNDAYKAFDRVWRAKGTGWFTEVVDDMPFTEQVEIFAYNGSSTYDTMSMSKLIDYLIDEAQQMDLQIAYDLLEIERIKESWTIKGDEAE